MGFSEISDSFRTLVSSTRSRLVARGSHGRRSSSLPADVFDRVGMDGADSFLDRVFEVRPRARLSRTRLSWPVPSIRLMNPGVNFTRARKSRTTKCKGVRIWLPKK